MKIAQGMKLISEGWIQKPKGFRVRFQQFVDDELVTGYSPGLEDKPLDSDVTTWRYAWKLFKATQAGEDILSTGELVNVTVVDDQDTMVIYYATGKTEIFNP
ncbi:MAG: hypothetical protein KAR45_15980, partial [Desulfobacteraceae bacterium]|nr:hypothetical protein [Desulfobacteraceae bacterium]